MLLVSWIFIGFQAREENYNPTMDDKFNPLFFIKYNVKITLNA